jgi:hypothetical protein
LILNAIRTLAMCDALARGVVEHPVEKIAPVKAYVHARRARAAATTDVPARVPFYLGYRESRFRRQYHPGVGQCGVTQIETYDDVDYCRRLADDHGLAYRAAVEHLEEWLRACRKMRQPGLECAMTGYADGTKAAKNGDYRAARRSLRMAKYLEKGSER